MKKILNAFLFCFLVAACSLSAQVVYEDFEGGTADLPWAALDGTFNGVVANPASGTGNTSANVGSYTKGAGFGYSLFWAPNLPALDISEYNQFKLKVWCSVATPILLKFEGTGPAVEKSAVMPAANEWVELTFDMSAGAGNAGFTKIIIFFDPGNDPSSPTYYFDDLVAYKAGVCYEDFEGGASAYNWQGLDGMYTGPVANPGANSVNSSVSCGQYVKSTAHAYSLLLADTGTPFDMSSNNQFKLQIYATAATQILMKLEGTGPAVEKTQNIAITDTWQEYTFDFSAAAGHTGLSKVILFFDPGVETSGDTYYFDNLCALPLGACTGVTVDPHILDDFECNRNITYAFGWDSLHVVNNPHVNGDNGSAKVGQVNDATGAGSEWYPLVTDYEAPIDLTEFNQMSIQIWAPKVCQVLLKLEGGPNPVKEVFVNVTEANKWVTYTGDFSDQAGKGHKKWVLFFNAGVNGEAGDIYYYDNWTLSKKATAPPLEDFEGALHLGWQPLDQNNTLHGNFAGPTANANPNSVNGSASVGCYSKGASPFSTLQAFSLTAFDLSVNKQFNIDVFSPAGGGTVVMQLNSATQGNKEVDAEVTTPGAWETLSFDFSAFDAVTDFFEIRLLFNPNTVASGESWCIDNLRQSEVTVDPCAGTVPVPNIVDDFECQRFNTIFYGASDLVVVNNPQLAPENGSLKVGEYKDPANQEWAGIGYQFGGALDLSLYNHLQMQIWATEAVPIKFKLEGGTQPAVEIDQTIGATNAWYKFDVDFSAHSGTDHNKLVIFVNPGVANAQTTYYLDNIKWSRAGYNGCIDDHQTAGNTISNFTYFANGHLESSGYQFEVVANPNASGINTSSTVGKFVKASDSAPWAGMYADLDAVIDWKGVKTAKVKVHMDHIGNFAIKLEGSQTGAPAIELPVANTVTGAWQELTYDFSAVADNAEYKRLTLFFDLLIDPTGVDVASYFDDIVIGEGACGMINVFNPLPVEAMVVSPNPVSDHLRVENFQEVVRMEIFNIYGQRLASVNTSNELTTQIEVSQFVSGVYTLAGYSRDGQLVGNAKFVKE